jgi:hypothetical protein
MEPGTGVTPESISRPRRDAKDSGSFSNCQAPEISQLDKIGGWAVRCGKFCQRVIESQKVLAWRRSEQFCRIQILAHEVTAAFQAFLAASVLNKDAAHGLGRSAEEVSAVVPVR